MSKPNSIVLFAIITNLLTATQLAFAGEPVFSPKESSPATVINIRGKESIVESLDMGPDPTIFWKKIQTIASDSDYLFDFEKTVKLLDLKTTDPIDLVSYKKLGLQERYDVKDIRYGIGKSIRYSVLLAGRAKNRRMMQLSVGIDLNQACISSNEVHRVFGNGKIGIPSHGEIPTAFYNNPTGISYSEAYGTPTEIDIRLPLTFSFANSGCVNYVYFTVPINE